MINLVLGYKDYIVEWSKLARMKNMGDAWVNDAKRHITAAKLLKKEGAIFDTVQCDKKAKEL